MASAIVSNEDLKIKFEEWLLSELKKYNKDVDESLVSYISSIASDDENPSEERIEAVESLLQELNQVNHIENSL